MIVPVISPTALDYIRKPARGKTVVVDYIAGNTWSGTAPMLAVSTQTNRRNLEPYNEYWFEDVKVLVSNDVVQLGEELVITMRKKWPFKALQGHINKVAACPLPKESNHAA